MLARAGKVPSETAHAHLQYALLPAYQGSHRQSPTPVVRWVPDKQGQGHQPSSQNSDEDGR